MRRTDELGTIDLLAVLRRDGDSDLLAEALLLHAERGGLLDGGVLVDGGLDLRAGDVLAAADDEVLGAVLQAQRRRCENATQRENPLAAVVLTMM